jgi:hypothetical protein
MTYGLSRNACVCTFDNTTAQKMMKVKECSRNIVEKRYGSCTDTIFRLSKAGKPCPSKLQHLLYINDCTPQQTLVDACAFHTSLPSTIPPLSSTNAKHVTTIIIQQYMYSPSSMTHYPLGVFFLASALTRRLYSACHTKNDCVIISR